MTDYTVLIHSTAYHRVEDYQNTLSGNAAATGSYLREQLAGKDVSRLGTSDFIEHLIQTKRPQIFAESAVVGDGSDWSPVELSLLGDISIAVPVTVFDDGRHNTPKVHRTPFSATLLYVPGALLRNGRGETPADWDEVTLDGKIDEDAYYGLYERRLLPGFQYADQAARANGKQAFITIPGLGCGQFAGKFHGQLGEVLRKALIRFLDKHAHRLPHIRAVYYDPYRECQNERIEIAHIPFFVRPLTQHIDGKSQLCPPQDYQESGDNFSNCELFSFVAWDHVSWPGNDFYIGSRATDDGVKAAATSSMAVITGVEGRYNRVSYTYDPPMKYRNWYDVVQKDDIKLKLADNLQVLE